MASLVESPPDRGAVCPEMEDGAPAYLLIADRLDAIGQKFRLQRILRGLMLWTAAATAATTLAALASHAFGNGRAGPWVLAGWVAFVIVTAIAWILRPLLLRPKPAEVARLIESRVPGLHNGLTNAVLLAHAADLRGSPFLPAIFREVIAGLDHQPVDSAVRYADLRPMALRAGTILLAVAVLGVLMPRTLAHGWRQMFSPGAFVPAAGSAILLDIQPGDVTLVSGQPMEVTVTADLSAVTTTGEGDPPGALILDGAAACRLELHPEPRREGPARYTYRLEHVDAPLRYRVEVAGTQSRWYDARVVQRVKLQELSIAITPPRYAQAVQPPRTVTLKPEEIDKTPLVVPQGSRIDFAAEVDVPVNGAVLQLGDAAPAPMDVQLSGRRFGASFVLTRDTPVILLLTDGAMQTIARLPEQSLLLRVTPDAPPAIQMGWPPQDVSVAPDAPLRLTALIRDDLGVASARVLLSSEADAPLAPVVEHTYGAASSVELAEVLEVKPELRRHGQSIRVQVEAVDNRDLSSSLAEGGPQTASSAVFEVRFRDPQQIAREQQEKLDRLRAALMEMLKQQQALHAQAVAFQPADLPRMKQIALGQSELRSTMQRTAETFPFDADNVIVQKTLLVLAYSPAREAVELADAVGREPVEEQRLALNADLQSRQRRIVSALQSLLALLNPTPEPTTQPAARPGGDLASKAEQFQKLAEALRQFIKEEQRILDQTAALAKKPVDDWDEKDKQLLDELIMGQEKLDAFMQQQVNDLSKLAEQDMSNASLLKELMEVYSEVTMAKDALKQQATEIAVALEETGVELAKSIETNLEKWLLEEPDRQKWSMEDPLEKTDVPMPELPTELEDMVGELMEQQEDLFEEMEDAQANWADSLDKGAGWGAADGPIANMSAKGVTGNALPNNNDMGGRSGEGRSGKSQGEMVEDTATGKGGRNTPTRLDPTPFQPGQVNDQSKDPVGGASGGGKLSGQGGEGLEGPVPPALKEQMQRLAEKQTQLRNAAERLDLQYRLGRYDHFKLLESIALMRRVESDLNANRYQNALRRRDVLLDSMDTSHLLLSGRIHVQHDTTPTMPRRLEQDLHDATEGPLPPAWEEALKEYYRKLGRE